MLTIGNGGSGCDLLITEVPARRGASLPPPPALALAVGVGGERCCSLRGSTKWWPAAIVVSVVTVVIVALPMWTQKGTAHAGHVRAYREIAGCHGRGQGSGHGSNGRNAAKE